MDEFSVIRRYLAAQEVVRDDVRIGIGDDAAVVEPPAGRQLVMTADVLVSGVHFPPATDARAIGHKALAVNLSDIAAMGAEPAWATMTLTMPDTDATWLTEFCDGLFTLASRYCVQLIGGDLARGPLAVGIHLVGFAEKVLSRAGATPGEAVYVSGELGDAALALAVVAGNVEAAGTDAAFERLNFPTPRVELGRALIGHAGAAIDVSDGLVADLGHVAQASSVAIEIELDRLPLSRAYRHHFEHMGWDGAAAFGDDYELCFTAPLSAPISEVAELVGVPVTRIGQVKQGSGVSLRQGERWWSPASGGFSHFD